MNHRVLPWKFLKVDWINDKNNEEIILPDSVNPWEIEYLDDHELNIA